jgi:hypothetical protein
MTAEARQKSTSTDAVEVRTARPSGIPTMISTTPAVTMGRADAVGLADVAADVAGGEPSAETCGPRSCCCWPTNPCTAIS